MPPDDIAIEWPVTPIIIGGPTAVGKTRIAIELAQLIGGEIINADSMQIYQEMEIGTAKPTPEERAQVCFHLLDIVKPDDSFTVSDWKALAEKAIGDITDRGRKPILCGGTGMYLRALLENWSLAGAGVDLAIRDSLKEEVERLGAPALHERLNHVDPESARRLHPNDGVRIIRALEVYQQTGTTLSQLQNEDRTRHTRRKSSYVVLTTERPLLYKRIDARVDFMLQEGLQQETAELIQKGYKPELHAMRSLGYREMCAYLQGELTLEAASDEIKKNTRRYAKRQWTWFRSEPDVVWIDTSTINSEMAVRQIVSLLPEMQRP